MHHFTPPTPVIATGQCYAGYLAAARANIEHMLNLSQGLRDAEGERAAQLIADTFADAATEMEELIAESEANQAVFDGDQFWRESSFARNCGMGEVA